MAQSAGFSKNSLNINPVWEKASAESPLERTKWAAIFKKVFAKDGIEVRSLQRTKPHLVKPTQPNNVLEKTGETEAQKKNREVRNQEKRVVWENHVLKAREKGFLCTYFWWDVRPMPKPEVIFLSLGAEGQRHVQQKRPGFDLHTVTTSDLKTTLEDIFVTNRIVAFER